MEARDEDWVSQLFVASTHSYVFFFSDRGKTLRQEGLRDPAGSREEREGPRHRELRRLEPGEKIAAITPVAGFAEGTSSSP
jgi:DNA gyrase subunit A